MNRPITVGVCIDRTTGRPASRQLDAVIYEGVMSVSRPKGGRLRDRMEVADGDVERG
jgi:hypothetical protein